MVLLSQAALSIPSHANPLPHHIPNASNQTEFSSRPGGCPRVSSGMLVCASRNLKSNSRPTPRAATWRRLRRIRRCREARGSSLDDLLFLLSVRSADVYVFMHIHTYKCKNACVHAYAINTYLCELLACPSRPYPPQNLTDSVLSGTEPW